MIYEYRCDQCGRAFNVRATLAEKEAGLRPSCPHCLSERTSQVFSAVFVRGGPTAGAPPASCGPGAMPGCCPS